MFKIQQLQNFQKIGRNEIKSKNLHQDSRKFPQKESENLTGK